jgi:hypothetical protein
MKKSWMSAVLLVLSIPADAAGPLKPKFALDEKSGDALVVVEAVPQKIVEEWYIGLNEYSLDTKRFIGGVFKGNSLLQRVDGQKQSPRYFVGVVKRAGTHVLYSLGTQALWGACFDKGARAFTFEPGKVYFIGAVDPNEGLRRIVTELPRESSHTPYFVYGMQLSYTPPGQRTGWQQDLNAFLAEYLPKVKAPVVEAEGIEVAFTPGRAPAGNPICRDNN